jgi:DNA-binding NarL/FixJ family response regulator
LCAGWVTDRIAQARQLFVSEGTVKTHIDNLFSKIGARDRAQAVAYAFRNGLAGG